MMEGYDVRGPVMMEGYDVRGPVMMMEDMMQALS